MIPITLTSDDAFLIDNSSLERFATCARSAEYYLGRKRESSRDRAALTFGKILHRALETRYLDNAGVNYTPTLGTAMKAVVLDEYSRWQPPEDDYRTADLALAVVDAYNTQYSFEPFDVVRLPNGKPGVEIPFALTIGKLTIDSTLLVRDAETGVIAPRHVHTITIVWTGKIDLLIRVSGRFSFMDHKTTSMMGPSYFKDFELSHQMMGYTWAAQQLLGVAIDCFHINALGVRKPTKTGRGIELQRCTVPVAQWQVAEFVTDTLELVAGWLNMCAAGYAPKQTKWCVGKYGACPYVSVCSLPPEQRDLMLSTADFKDVTWSPLKED